VDKTGKPSSTRIRILVAEDEALIRMDLVEMLGEAGYEVVAEAAPVEAAPEEVVVETTPIETPVAEVPAEVVAEAAPTETPAE